MLIATALAVILALGTPVVSATPEGVPLNPALVERHADQYLGRDLSMTGTVYEWDGEWCLTDVRLEVLNRLRLRLATPTLLQPFANTVYLPRTKEAFRRSLGCEVRVVGIFASEPDRPDQHFFLVLDVTARPDPR
jgi:hypothetical protein